MCGCCGAPKRVLYFTSAVMSFFLVKNYLAVAPLLGGVLYLKHLCNKCRVCFDDKIRFGDSDKKIHSSEAYPLYVGICKKRTSQNDLDFFVHSGEMDFFVHCKKVEPFGTSISYLDCRFAILLVGFVAFRSHTHQVHSNRPQPQLQTRPHPPHCWAGHRRHPRAGRHPARRAPPGNCRYGHSPPADAPDNNYDNNGRLWGGT